MEKLAESQCIRSSLCAKLRRNSRVSALCRNLPRLNLYSTRNGKKSDAIGPKTASKFVQAVMYQYWIACRRAFAGALHVSISLDAGRIGGDDIMDTAVYSTEKRIGCWAPPQVRVLSAENSHTPHPTPRYTPHPGARLFRELKAGASDSWLFSDPYHRRPCTSRHV